MSVVFRENKRDNVTKFALLGSSGYVGRIFLEQLLRLNIDTLVLTREDTKAMDVDALANKLVQCRVTSLINAAGFTGKPNVDACEHQKADCLHGNAVLPGYLSKVAASAGISWGHVSSGCIYNGNGPRKEGFNETDAPNFSFRSNFCSFYSGTKALGEEILADDPNCYVWRMRMPFSHVDSARNYLSKLMRYERLLDATNSLSNLEDYVAACIQCLIKELPRGTYNLTNPGSVSTRQVVQRLVQAGLASDRFEFFASEAKFMEKAAIAPRSNCILDPSKALAAGIELPPIWHSIDRCLKNWIPESRKR
jgi:UDP-glucose 4,6-dehydratase